MQYDITHRDGKPYVLIPLHDYRKQSTDMPLQRPKTDENGDEHPVKFFRKKNSLTQKELAEKAGLSRTYLTEIETGAKNGSIDAYLKIAQALNITINDLVRSS
ncbi:MAG: transcriptional regulator [Alphaproteobacteria bacterium]|nr:transcriptional regulator [Alphaproteobacteria bacterium]